MAAPPLPVKGKRNRQLMVYAGAAGALLLLFLLARRGQAAATAQPADQAPQLTPVSSAAPGDLGTGGTVDNSAQLAGFESALLDQLPQAVSSGVAAGLANGLPPAASITDGGQTPAGGAAGAGSFADYAASATSLVTLGATLAGAQNGPGAGKPQPKKATTKKKPAPKPKPKPKPKPPAPKRPAPKPPHVAKHPNDKHKR